MSSGTRQWQWLKNLPNATLLTVRRECAASIPLAVLLGVLNASFCGFVGRKGLGMSDAMLGLVMASQMTGLLMAGMLVGFFHQVRKIRALSRILYIVSVVLLSIAFLPRSESIRNFGVYVFLLQIFLAQVGIALMTTLRTSIWRANYPAAHRGKIVVLIYFLITLGHSLTVFAFTAMMDKWHFPFQMVYGISGVLGLICGYLFSRIRICREGGFIRSQSVGLEKIKLLAGLSVLRSDRRFRQYMSWQMLNGFATMVVETGILVLIINDVFQSGWLLGGSALTGVQFMTAAVAGLLWARVYDRSDIFTMRFYGAVGWALSRMVLVLGVYYHSMVVVLVSRAISGVAMGAGRLNWRLGHMEFAPPEKDSLYMGAHVSLTGLRGMVAPFVGIYLFRINFLGPNGIWLIILSGLGQAISGLGFLHMKYSHKSCK